MKQRHNESTFFQISALLFFLFISSIAQAMQAPERDLKCRTSSGEQIRLKPMQLDMPLKIIEERGRPFIAFDSDKLSALPRPVILFEKSMKCMEINEFVNQGSVAEEVKSYDAEKDCAAINLLRDQDLISYREFYEIIKFYKGWKGIEKKERGDPRRVKELLGCYKSYRPKALETPRSFKVR